MELQVSVSYVCKATVNVPNKNRFFRGLNIFLFFKVISHSKKKLFTYWSTEMSAASNDAKII
jgi:hypothetical protein